MSNNGFEEFTAKILNSSALQDQLKATSDRGAFVRKLIEMGAAAGYQFQADEVEERIDAFSQERGKALTDQDLALVAGGLPKNGGLTIFRCGESYTTDYGPCTP